MKNSYILNFQPVESDINLTREARYEARGSILVVGEYDDLCLDLKLENYDVQAIENITKAAEWLHQQTKRNEPLPDVIIISNQINDNNSNTVQSLKSNNTFKDIPIIFVAEKFKESERDLAIQVGADDYYTENINAKYLSLRIEFLRRVKELSKESDEEVGKKQKTSLYNGDSFKMWSLKRAFDIIVSASLLLVLSPLLILIIIAIKLDSEGPVFYISKRAGKGYQIFNFYKFRSMKKDADRNVDELKHLNQYQSDNSESVFFKVKNDPRITRLGGFLRKTSLDELPQLINVLKGDMSLVGNRPLPLYEAERLTQDQWALRFLAPAGITGLWQITKRGKDDMSEEERVALDMEYATKNSFLYDLGIMLKTPAALLQKEEV